MHWTRLSKEKIKLNIYGAVLRAGGLMRSEKQESCSRSELPTSGTLRNDNPCNPPGGGHFFNFVAPPPLPSIFSHLQPCESCFPVRLPVGHGSDVEALSGRTNRLPVHLAPDEWRIPRPERSPALRMNNSHCCYLTTRRRPAKIRDVSENRRSKTKRYPLILWIKWRSSTETSPDLFCSIMKRFFFILINSTYLRKLRQLAIMSVTVCQ